jgi:hypothetical protein
MPTTHFTEQNKLILPAGDYIITDPCYIFPNQEWIEEFCNQLPNNFDTVIGEYLNLQFLCFNTAHGDGSYDFEYTNYRAEIGVDAGLISIVPLTLALQWTDREELTRIKTDTQIFSVTNSIEAKVINNNLYFDDNLVLSTNYEADYFQDEDEDEEN